MIFRPSRHTFIIERRYTPYMRIRTLMAFLLSLACADLSGSCQNIPSSCRTNDWFELQSQADAGVVSLLCRGVISASLERRAAAEHMLRNIMGENSNRESIVAAHEALGNMYYREGRYRLALNQLDLELAADPNAADAREVRPFFAALARQPDLEVLSSAPSRFKGEVVANNLFLPVKANGIAGSYIVDSGANISALSQSEAGRLGLNISQTASRASDISGISIGAQVTEISDLWVGKTHLKHVAFLVYPDSSEPFSYLPDAHKGVLGIPVLIALGIMRIDKNLNIEVNSRFAPSIVRTLPLVFNGATPVTQVSVNGKPASFILDIGATRTYLYPSVVKVVPEFMQKGRRQYERITGVSGDTALASIVLPSVQLSLGRTVLLSPATVLLNVGTGNSRWAAGNLGYDLISKDLPVILDFKKMQIVFEAH
jgi:predicted aspartyl protease